MHSRTGRLPRRCLYEYWNSLPFQPRFNSDNCIRSPDPKLHRISRVPHPPPRAHHQNSRTTSESRVGGRAGAVIGVIATVACGQQSTAAWGRTGAVVAPGTASSTGTHAQPAHDDAPHDAAEVAAALGGGGARGGAWRFGRAQGDAGRSIIGGVAGGHAPQAGRAARAVGAAAGGGGC